jgi:hypothetical protein
MLASNGEWLVAREEVTSEGRRTAWMGLLFCIYQPLATSHSSSVHDPELSGGGPDPAPRASLVCSPRGPLPLPFPRPRPDWPLLQPCHCLGRSSP